MEIVLATRNRDKISEIEAILSPLDVRLLTLDGFPDAPEVVEDGETMEQNALKKSRAIRDATGTCALADDSGLEIDALGFGIKRAKRTGFNVAAQKPDGDGHGANFKLARYGLEAFHLYPPFKQSQN